MSGTYSLLVSDERAEKVIVEDTPQPDRGVVAAASKHLLRTGQFHGDARHSTAVSR